jgi:NhaP-type Na+/H+ or K+/H+ antiporter
MGVLVGLLVDYLIRLTDFKQEQRSVSYSEFFSAFITAAHPGAALGILGIQLGEALFDQVNHDQRRRRFSSKSSLINASCRGA